MGYDPLRHGGESELVGVPCRSCLAGFAALLSLAGAAAQAEPGLFQARDPAGAVPLGSFEVAALPVFVRAHASRRELLASAAAPVARPIRFEPVPAGQADGSEAAELLETDSPGTTGSTGRTRWVAPSDRPAWPGALAAEAPEIASPFAKPGLLGAHATPDLELELSRRATIGVFGEAGRIEPTDIRNATTRTTRDLGAGFTLQYRFGE